MLVTSFGNIRCLPCSLASASDTCCRAVRRGDGKNEYAKTGIELFITFGVEAPRVAFLQRHPRPPPHCSTRSPKWSAALIIHNLSYYLVPILLAWWRTP